jgi:RNA polymerase sigma-70 factor (ECF subfamily)
MRTEPDDSALAFAMLRSLADEWTSRERELFALGVASGRSEHPRLVVEEAAFAERVRRVLVPTIAAEEQLATLAFTDLFLVHACLAGDVVALGQFDRMLDEEATRALSRLKLDHDTTEEAKQLLREKLLVKDGDAIPRLEAYAGRGPLRAWLRTSALRTAISDARRTRRDEGEEALRAANLLTDDPEAEYIRERYATEYKQAFEEAFATLSVRARTLLKMHLLEGMSVDDMARAYGEHRSSTWRALKAARDQILEQARQRLVERLALSSREFESLMRLVQSRLDLDLTELLTG